MALSRSLRCLFYETPLGLTQKYNGWAGREVIQHYVRYAETVFNRL